MLIARVTLLYRYFLNTTLRPCPNRLNRRNLRTRRGPVRNPVKAFLNKIFRCTFGGVRPRTILLPNEVHVGKCGYKLRVHELLQHLYVELCVHATFHNYERTFESDCNPTRTSLRTHRTCQLEWYNVYQPMHLFSLYRFMAYLDTNKTSFRQ